MFRWGEENIMIVQLIVVSTVVNGINYRRTVSVIIGAIPVMYQEKDKIGMHG